jgi:hypothetical protein
MENWKIADGAPAVLLDAARRYRHIVTVPLLTDIHLIEFGSSRQTWRGNALFNPAG